MEPSIKEKNVAIAEMLGWQGISETAELLYHSDANWQFEAIDWINKNNPTRFKIKNRISSFDKNWWEVEINIFKNTGNKNLYIVGTDQKEAIFEALYQFSEYLKKK